jgi:hypothetical protein
LAKIQQTLVVEAKKKLFEKLSPAFLNNVTNQIGQIAIRIIERRTASGIDVNGKKFRPLSPKYIALKKRVIAGDNKAKGKYKSGKKQGKARVNITIARLIKQKIPGKAARAIPDYMQLTGRLMDSLSFHLLPPKIIFNRVVLSVRFFLRNDGGKPSNDLKAEGLQQMGRDMFFMSKSGVYKIKERQIISEFVSDAFKNRLSGIRVKS